jgi:hypothetical protein
MEKDCEMCLEHQHTFPSFGDTIISLRKQHFRVRLLRDRGDWFVEASSDQKPDEWYDMALLQEEVTSQVEKDVLDFDEQAAILRAKWQEIEDMLTGSDSNVVHASLERRRQERAKRRFPKWHG